MSYRPALWSSLVVPLVLSSTGCGRIGYGLLEGDAGVDPPTDAGPQTDGGRPPDGGVDASPDAGLVGWTHVAAGADHTCAIRDGDAYCWGEGASGQIGDGSSAGAARPTLVAGLPRGRVTDVDPGVNHTCAIADGAVFCWGAGNNGELGDGASRASPVPVAVTGLPSPALDVSCGDTFTCAIAGARVYCWGSDSAGRLGNGAGGSSDVPTTVALADADAALAAQVTAGQDHACARLSDGRGFCWGHNDGGGALGDGTGVGGTESPTQMVETGLTHHDIAGWHACGLSTGGRLRCWGLGSSGHLGDGTGASSAVPVQPVGLEAGVLAYDVGGGPTDQDATCAIQGGALLCWGANQRGRLGTGSADPPTIAVPTAHTGIPGTPAQVAMGYTHGCARNTAGELYCWGRGDRGQLGDGRGADDPAVVRVLDP